MTTDERLVFLYAMEIFCNFYYKKNTSTLLPTFFIDGEFLGVTTVNLDSTLDKYIIIQQFEYSKRSKLTDSGKDYVLTFRIDELLSLPYGIYLIPSKLELLPKAELCIYLVHNLAYVRHIAKEIYDKQI